MINYKKIIKSEKIRYWIIRLFDFLPDSIMVKIQYRIKTGRKLNLKKPERYSEKLQWMKVYYRNETMKKCADKADVRCYVENKGMAKYLNKCYGVFDSVEDIPWDELPQKFVIKDTLGGGGRFMIFVHNKNELDISEANHIMNKWINTPTKKKNLGREWVYDGRKHRIIIEEFLITDEMGDVPDYKFFCFDGKVFCSYMIMMKNHMMHRKQGVLGFLDRDFKLLDAHRIDFKPMVEQPKKPKNYEEMMQVAEILSEGFPHVRVDFYNINGRIVFGEMTFFNASGYSVFEPDEFDYTLGGAFTLPKLY